MSEGSEFVINADGVATVYDDKYDITIHCESEEEHYEVLRRLMVDAPEAQPEIVRCKDCKHHWTHRCMDSMPTEICDLNQTFYDPNIDFCSLAERRTDE